MNEHFIVIQAEQHPQRQSLSSCQEKNTFDILWGDIEKMVDESEKHDEIINVEPDDMVVSKSQQPQQQEQQLHENQIDVTIIDTAVENNSDEEEIQNQNPKTPDGRFK